MLSAGVLHQVLLQGLEHHLEGFVDIDVDRVEHPVGPGLRVDLVHLPVGRDAVGAAVLAPRRGRDDLDMVEDIQVHVVLHVVERGLDRDRLCQIVGQQGVVPVVVDVAEEVRIEQPGKHHVAQLAEVGNFFTVHIFFASSILFA